MEFNISEKYAENLSHIINHIVSDTFKWINTLDIEEVGEVCSIRMQNMVHLDGWNPCK